MTAWHLSVRVGGFQNPGVCLQAFPSFPSPSPLLIAPFIASRTAQKRLLRRLTFENLTYKGVKENIEAQSMATASISTRPCCP